MKLIGSIVPDYKVKRLIGNQWIFSQIPFLRKDNIAEIDGKIYLIKESPQQTDGIWDLKMERKMFHDHIIKSTNI